MEAEKAENAKLREEVDELRANMATMNKALRDLTDKVGAMEKDIEKIGSLFLEKVRSLKRNHLSVEKKFKASLDKVTSEFRNVSTLMELLRRGEGDDA